MRDRERSATPDSGLKPSRGLKPTWRGFSSGRHQHAIHQSFELLGALGELAASLPARVPAAEQLVGDVQGGEHRQPQ